MNENTTTDAIETDPTEETHASEKIQARPTLKQRFSRLSPKVQRFLLIGVAGGIFGGVLLGGYYWRDKRIEEKPVPQETQEIRMDRQIMEKSLYVEAKQMIIDQKRKTEELAKQLKRFEDDLEKRRLAVGEHQESKNPQAARTETSQTKAAQKPEDKKAGIRIPEPPAMAGKTGKKGKAGNFAKTLFNSGPPPVPTENSGPRFVGGIEMVSVPVSEKTEPAPSDKKKQIYLPPSFMGATLLSGVAAPTTQAAKGNPLPLLFRVKDLAVLPNKVKANLKGCFVIGSGIGNLADERVHIRLNTLSCVAKNGDAVIDQPVKGFVVDGDGKVGLKGRVVAKMGVHVARTALANFIGGMGSALNASTQTIGLSALGQPQSQMKNTDAGSIATAGLGQGISSATRELQKFYLQLAEQTLPVIEIGSTKGVTLVISEGVGLNIMEKGSSNEKA